MSAHQGGDDPMDPFEHDDAAYLLGALGPEERTAFSDHLLRCDACAGRVAALRPVVAALAGLGDAARDVLESDAEPGAAAESDHAVALDGAAGLDRLAGRDHAVGRDHAAGAVSQRDGGPPDAGGDVTELMRRVERRRRRQRWALGGLSGLAAAAIAALIVVLSLPTAGQRPESVAGQQMFAMPGSSVQATASVTGTTWGTEISLECRYAATGGYPSGGTYTLQVIDRAGKRYQLGSWVLAGTSQIRFTSGVALHPASIRSIQVVDAEGMPMLKLTE